MPQKLTPAQQKRRRREQRLLRQYNINLAEYDAILAHQGGVCFICKRPAYRLPLNCDHRHGDGLLRGLVCGRCNKGMQYFRDNPDYLSAAAEYLKKPPATTALGGERYGLPGRGGTKKQRRLWRQRQKAASKLVR